MGIIIGSAKENALLFFILFIGSASFPYHTSLHC
jgi:hypothetical protein